MRFTTTIIAGFFTITITLSNFITVTLAAIPDLCGSSLKNKNTKQTAPVVGSCTKFYQCDEGEVVVKECKLFTKYDSITGKCAELDGNEPAFCSEGSTLPEDKLLLSFLWLCIFVVAIVVVMMTDTTEETIL